MTEASAKLVEYGFSKKVVPPTNARKGQALILAEAPGRREDEEGITLHPEADAGGLFTRLLQRVGVSRDGLTLMNCVMQRPPRNELYDSDGRPMFYTHEAVEYWKPSVMRFIEEMQPPVIVGLGRTALEVLTGFTDIGTTRGYVHNARIATPQDRKPCECVVDGKAEDDCFLCGGEGTLESWDWDHHDLNCPVVCTYHPQFLNYGQKHLSGVFIRDVLAGLEIGREGWKPPQLKVVPMPTVDEFRWFCQQYNPERHVLTYDIENPMTRGLDEDVIEAEFGKKEISYEIDRLSFCFDSDIGGWSVPFEAPYIELAQRLVESARVLRGHNCRLHDRPRLVSKGFRFNGREEDTLELWRHLHRTLPASVAYIAPFYLSISPWKHQAHSQPEWYSAMDAVVQHHIGEGIERDLRSTGQWEMAQAHVVRILDLTEKMAENGLPYDRERAKEFERELQAKLDERNARLNELVPECVKPVKQKKGLKRVPKDRTGYVLRMFRVSVLDLAKGELILPSPDETKSKALAASGKAELPRVNRWAKLLPFNPNSHVQKKALIRHFGHKCKTDRKSKEETSNDSTLKSLITTYIESTKPQDAIAVECYQLIRECVAISKVLGTYVRGWQPGPDGLIHATPGIWGDMFRISWRDPNLAATVADKKEVQIASGFRKCIASSKGDVIVECDWKAMEAQLVAFFAGDADYARLAKLSTNAYMASHILGRPADLAWSDKDLGAYLREIRNDPRNTKVYDDAKHCCYLINYGGTPYLMSEMYELPKARAQWLFDLFFSLFPKVKKWQQSVIQEAHEKCRLVNKWGYRMPIWDAYTWNQKRYERLRKLWVEVLTSEARRKRLTVREKKDVERIERVLTERGGIDEDAIRSCCYDLGTEAKAALSFLPRDSGAAMLKDVIVAAEDEYALISQGFIRATAHDSVISVVPYERAEEVGELVRGLQERPVARLDGLVIESDAAYGFCWDKKSLRSSMKYLPRPVEAVAV